MNAPSKRQSRPTIDQLRAEAEALQAQAATLAEQTEALNQQLRHARGTREIPEQPSELYSQIRKLIGERPMRFAEILAALPGVDELQFKAALERVKRDPGVVNLGSDAKAMYFLPDPEVLRRIVNNIKPSK